MRYELNFDEDKVNDVLVVGGASYDLKGCCDIMNEQQATIQSLEEENEQLRNSMKKLENVNLVIELKYSYGYEKYLADVRVVDNE